MSDLNFALSICNLKKYISIIRDKSESNPLPPRVEFNASEMSTSEKSTFQELFYEFEEELFFISKRLIEYHEPRESKGMHEEQIFATMYYVINRFIRLSCKYTEIGDFGLKGYLTSCFSRKARFEKINWRRFIEDVDTNVPQYIKNEGDACVSIFRYLRKHKINMVFDKMDMKLLSIELSLDVDIVSDAIRRVVELCIKNDDAFKIIKKYQQYAADGNEESLFNEVKTDDKFRIFPSEDLKELIKRIKKPLNKIINELNPSEWQLLDAKIDIRINEKEFLLGGEDKFGTDIAKEFNITKEKDIYNRIDTIINRITRNFKEFYAYIVERESLSDSAIKKIIKHYVYYSYIRR